METPLRQAEEIARVACAAGGKALRRRFLYDTARMVNRASELRAAANAYGWTFVQVLPSPTARFPVFTRDTSPLFWSASEVFARGLDEPFGKTESVDMQQFGMTVSGVVPMMSTNVPCDFILRSWVGSLKNLADVKRVLDSHGIPKGLRTRVRWRLAKMLRPAMFSATLTAWGCAHEGTKQVFLTGDNQWLATEVLSREITENTVELLSNAHDTPWRAIPEPAQ